MMEKVRVFSSLTMFTVAKYEDALDLFIQQMKPTNYNDEACYEGFLELGQLRDLIDQLDFPILVCPYDSTLGGRELIILDAPEESYGYDSSDI